MGLLLAVAMMTNTNPAPEVKVACNKIHTKCVVVIKDGDDISTIPLPMSFVCNWRSA